MLFIFDWDGTVINSADKIVRCMQAAMEETGLEVLNTEPIRQIIGLGMHEATAELFPQSSQEQRSALQQSYARHFIAAEQTPCKFFAGCLELIQQLREQGHLTAVATGKSRRGLDRVFNSTGQGRLFHASRCADETASKPDPRMLLELLDELRVSPEEAVMIGDTEFDLQMANNASLTPVGVSFGVHSIERLQKTNPAHIAHSYADLKAWISGRYGC